MKLKFVICCVLLHCVISSYAEEFENSVDGSGENGSNEGQKLCKDLLKVSDPLSKYILKLIHEIQSHMHDGIPEMGIPPLDPLELEDYAFNLKERQFKASGELKDIVVNKLSTFNVTEIKTSLMHMNVNLTIDIPFFAVQGNYKVKGKFLKIFPVFGKGRFELKPIKVTYKIYAYAEFKHGHPQLNSFDFEVGLQKLQTKFDGIMGGGVVSNVLNKIINAMGTKLFYRLEPKLHEQIRSILVTEINKMIEGASIFDLLMIGFGSSSDECNEV